MNKRVQVPAENINEAAESAGTETGSKKKLIWILAGIIGVVIITIIVVIFMIAGGEKEPISETTGADSGAGTETPSSFDTGAGTETGTTDTGIVNESENLVVTPECTIDGDCSLIYGGDLACLSGFCYERNVSAEDLECTIDDDCLFLGEGYTCITGICYPQWSVSYLHDEMTPEGGGEDGGTTASEGFFGFFQSSP